LKSPLVFLSWLFLAEWTGLEPATPGVTMWHKSGTADFRFAAANVPDFARQTKAPEVRLGVKLFE